MVRPVFVMMVTLLIDCGVAQAQQTPVPLAKADTVTPATPGTATALSNPPSTSAPITLSLPNSIRIEAATKESGAAGSLWVPLLSALFAGSISGWLGYKAREHATRELATKIEHFEKEQARRIVEWDDTRGHQRATMSIEQKRVTNELERFEFESGASAHERYLAATSFVHQQQVAEADLIKSLSDKLLGEAKKERLFALLVLSAYVDPEVIWRLAAGGEEIVSSESLETLAAVSDSNISEVAQSVLDARKAGSNAVAQQNPPPA